METSKLKLKDWKMCAMQFSKHEQMFSVILALIKIASRKFSIDINDETPGFGDHTIIFEVLNLSSGRVAACGVLGKLLHAMKNSDSIIFLETAFAWRNELGTLTKNRLAQDVESESCVKEDIADFEQICEKIDEFIIILHEMLANRIDLKEAVHLDLASWFYELIEGCDGKQLLKSVSEGGISAPCMDLLNHIQRSIMLSYPESSIEAQPRRIVASALTVPQLFIKCACCPENDGDDKDVQGNMQESCIAFKTLKSRKISCSDWFNTFADSMNRGFPSNDKVSDWLRFAFCVYELSFCGLIRKVDDTVEKAAMVWANG